MSSDGVEAVQELTAAIQDLLDLAHAAKPSHDIEPPLAISDFGGDIERIGSPKTHQSHDPVRAERDKQAQYAAIETAFRNLFYDLLASISIEDPAFVKVWNLLDIVSIFSDSEHCEPGLGLWLIEELLDSQTINGCRKIFDYLESRRERLIAKNFKQKNLIILRSCNELLRRLSRAEDTVFCGRVFIFLFQSFPLGDRSAVNLRGEYHLENRTTFDIIPPKTELPDNRMDIDKKDHVERSMANGHSKDDVQNHGLPGANDGGDQGEKQIKSVTFDAKNIAAQTPLDCDTLYSIFWSLQQDFSNPTRLFATENFEAFKKGLEATIFKFQEVHKEQENRGTLKVSEDHKRGFKRSREGDDEFASIFNPKYLTSRDLFELEISDLSFRRHVLVQALILIDFLVSLTPKAKAKLTGLPTPNKSVLYDYTLSDDDAKWATQTRSTVANYLQQGPEGKFYYRMVDTVLSRDKNWVRWKAENCPPIDRPPITPDEFLKAKQAGEKATASKRLRSTPLGSLDLSFLSESDAEKGSERLRDPAKWALPTPESFLPGIAKDEEAVKTAETDEERQRARDAKASKMWRMLRIASKSKSKLFDKIDDGNNPQAVFAPIFEHGKAEQKNGGETKTDIIGSESVDRREMSRDA
ncbi:MAG: hypothetical protein M1812_006159 [Candelaria pacifica]|nr:MAG: hypothetical protein M1812_006159 [Candelaria pacifica]